MLTIDSQVHAYERDHPGRPWAAVLAGPPEATGDQMVAAMDAVGVDCAILVSAFTMYRYDASYAIEVQNKHPDRFALIKPVDPADPAVADTIAEWAQRDGTVGIRIMMDRGAAQNADDPGLARVMTAAARHDLPVNFLAWGIVERLEPLAARYPDTAMVIDHVGMLQPRKPPAPPDAFADLPKVLKLATYKNVAIKISGACTMSQLPFPYADIWDPLARIFDAYGLERCMWGTDWTRTSPLLTYREGVEAFRVTDRLSDSDRATLMGGALTRIYGWSPKKR